MSVIAYGKNTNWGEKKIQTNKKKFNTYTPLLVFGVLVLEFQVILNIKLNTYSTIILDFKIVSRCYWNVKNN